MDSYGKCVGGLVRDSPNVARLVKGWSSGFLGPGTIGGACVYVFVCMCSVRPVDACGCACSYQDVLLCRACAFHTQYKVRVRIVLHLGTLYDWWAWLRGL